jgi:hypothetical protein
MIGTTLGHYRIVKQLGTDRPALAMVHSWST